MKLSQAAKILAGDLQGDDIQFEGVSTDTRQLIAKALFIPIVGDRFDGHDFLAEAATKGCAAAIISKSAHTELPHIVVENTRQALAKLGCSYRDRMKAVFIGVTGSCGKTTTKVLLARVFSQHGNTLASVRSFNNDIGVPLTLLQINPNHKYVVCEMGANHPGEIACYTHWVKPDIAIITNAAEAHLEGFGSVQGVACAKAEIFQGLKPDGVAIINADDHYESFWYRQAAGHRVVTFSCQGRGDVRAQTIELNERGQVKFQLVFPGSKPMAVQLQLFGAHNVMNALAASAAAYVKNIPTDMICAGLELATALGHRLSEKKGFAGATVIDDTYNANPLSVAAAVSVLAQRGGDSVFVLGDMLELGEYSEEKHRELGQYAKQQGIHCLYCYGNYSRSAAEAFGKNAYYFEHRDDLIAALRDYLHEDATVLIKGSNSMGMNVVANALTNDDPVREGARDNSGD